jgi:hypothetical protein
MINGNKETLPYNSENFTITKQGRWAVFNSDQYDLQVTYKKWNLFVFVNGTRYKNHICGLCGFFDGDSANDLRLRNGRHLQKTNLNVQFGIDWQYGSCGVEPVTENDTICTENDPRLRQARTELTQIFKTPAISECKEVIDLASFEFDLCACVDHDKCLCDMLAHNVEICQLKVVIKEFCGPVTPKCPNVSIECPATTTPPPVSTTTTLPTSTTPYTEPCEQKIWNGKKFGQDSITNVGKGGKPSNKQKCADVCIKTPSCAFWEINDEYGCSLFSFKTGYNLAAVIATLKDGDMEGLVSGYVNCHRSTVTMEETTTPVVTSTPRITTSKTSTITTRHTTTPPATTTPEQTTTKVTTTSPLQSMSLFAS